ncbi:MAG: protein translocase SEC61 complex subunit gamma [Thaumarchaeota archaeon]|nr:protein translocase SEC61 complex subunit gamma [Nitrososphaerota archaeon]
MGFKDFFKLSSVTLRLTRKPTKQEFVTAIKITLLGVAAIGGIAFVVKFIALAIQGV